MKSVAAMYGVKQSLAKFNLQISLILFYFLQFIFDWPLLKLSNIRGQFNFQDFVTIFTSAKCFRTIGLRIYIPDESHPECFYPYGRTFIYLIDLLRIPSAMAPFLVVCIFLGLVFLSLNLTGILSRTEKVFAFLFLASPPFWLAFERGNVDLLICFLVILAALTTSRKNLFATIFILCLATLIKFYTFPLLLFTIFANRKKLNWYFYVPLIFSIFLVTVADLRAQHLQQPGSFAFGTPVVTFWINAFVNNLNIPFAEISIRTGQFVGLVLLGVVTLLIQQSKFLLNMKLNNWDMSLQTLCLGYLGTVYVTCFTLGMSYDYRLIFAVLSGLFIVANPKIVRSTKLFIVSIWLISIWLSVFSFGFSPKMHLLIQWIGNLFDFFTAGLLIAMFLCLHPPKKYLGKIRAGFKIG